MSKTLLMTSVITSVYVKELSENMTVTSYYLVANHE